MRTEGPAWVSWYQINNFWMRLNGKAETALCEEMIRDKVVVEIIKNALATVRGEKLKTKYAVASLPEEKSFSS